MRKIVSLMHMSLDGFIAGTNGEMDWIHVDDEIFDHGNTIINEGDTAIYGRKTFGMMEGYWPTAAEQPNAGKHDIEHANWVNAATKLVVSNSLKHSDWAHTEFISGDVAAAMQQRKMTAGRNMILIGSASVNHYLMKHGLIDEYYINVNPVILGAGIPLFTNAGKTGLKLLSEKKFQSSVLGLHYEVKKNDQK